jgi:hypothetical protein
MISHLWEIFVSHPKRGVEDFGASNAHCLPISLATVHLLSSLLDRGQHGIIGNGRLGGHEGCLGFEVDVERLDACGVN